MGGQMDPFEQLLDLQPRQMVFQPGGPSPLRPW